MRLNIGNDVGAMTIRCETTGSGSFDGIFIDVFADRRKSVTYNSTGFFFT